MKHGILLLMVFPCVARAGIHYTLEPEPQNKWVKVSIEIDDAKPNATFRIPAWCPGFYTLKNYEAGIVNVLATNKAGEGIALRRPDPRTWTIDGTFRFVRVTYYVKGDDLGLGFFGVNVRDHTAFVNGPAAFMYVDGRKDEPVTLDVKNPIGWNTAVSLEKNSLGQFMAANYDEFIDSPIRLGHFERRTFNVEGVPFEAVYASTDQKYNFDLDTNAKVLATISRPAIMMFGKPTPFKRYIFFVNLAIGDFGGGLEHRASTVLAVPNSSREDFRTLASHEFFHAWNVKQMRPAVLGPFDYTQPCRTRNLWFAEGVTDYYSDLLAYRTGLFDQNWYFRSLGRNIDELQRSQTRKELTLEQVCLQTWEHSGFDVGDLSYYTKGLVVGLLLDAAIRGATAGSKSLDDVMRSMFDRYRLPKQGYPEDGILKAVNEVAGKDLTSLYDTMVRSTDEMPYDQLSAIGMRVLAPNGTYDSLNFILDGDRVLRTDVNGIEKGDEVVMVDGSPFGPGAFSSRKASYTLRLERAGKEVEVSISLTKKTARVWAIEPDPFASAEAAKRRAQWLTR